MRTLFAVVSLSLLFLTPAKAIDVTAPQVYMVDFETGKVLFEKNADQPMVPSSMSKIMTAYAVFDRIKSGDVKPDDMLHVSKEAWQKGGSRMFVAVDSKVSVDDLLKGLIVQSGNDACIVIAEGLSGTEAAFAEELTQRAHDLGAKNSTFINSTGWPDEGHVSTARDLALIAERTIRDFPKEYEKYYGLADYTYNNITQRNRNSLLNKNIGSDGMKTGRTDAGGFGIVASAKQGDRRLILVINGLPSSKMRDQEATALLNYGFNFFKNYKVFGKGDVAEMADVWGGTENTVPLVASQDLIFTLPRNKQKDMKVKLIYDTPLEAPITAGATVGEIEVTLPDQQVKRIPLLAGKDIEQAGFFQRIKNSVYYLLWGKHST